MSEAKKIIIGSILFVGTRFSERLLGLVSTLILARILTPDDFGIVAISLLVLNFFAVLSRSGAEKYIIKTTTLTDNIVNTAWTLNIILKGIIALLLVLTSSLIADFFNDQRLVDILYVISLLFIFDAFTSPCIALFKREQKYLPIFKLTVSQKAISVVVVIFIAIYYKSYWALILGHFVSSFVKFIGSYLIHNYRPKLCLENLTEQWAFSKWMVVNAIFGFSRSQMDTFFVSKFFSIADVGAFHVMKYISTMPGTQIIAPAAAPLLATLAKSKNEKENFSHQVNISLYVLIGISFPISAYFYCYSDLLVRLFLGSQWDNYSNLFGILSLLIVSYSFLNISTQILISLGKVKALFKYNLITFFLLFSLLFTVKDLSILYFAISRVIFEIIVTSSLLIFVSRKLSNINLFNYFITIGIAIISSSLSIYISSMLDFEQFNTFIRLLLTGASFFFTYLIIILFFYKTYYYKTKEGAHLAFLVIQSYKQIRNKFKLLIKVS